MMSFYSKLERAVTDSFCLPCLFGWFLSVKGMLERSRLVPNLPDASMEFFKSSLEFFLEPKGATRAELFFFLSVLPSVFLKKVWSMLGVSDAMADSEFIFKDVINQNRI